MSSLAETQDRPAVALSVAIPCDNQSNSLDELYARVIGMRSKQAGQSCEIVLVNDGSTDTSRDHVFRLAEPDLHAVAIDLARNCGHQAALS